MNRGEPMKVFVSVIQAGKRKEYIKKEEHRGRLFLPFIDDDPKTTEITSKIVMLAEDYKIKDHTVLVQIAEGRA